MLRQKLFSKRTNEKNRSNFSIKTSVYSTVEKCGVKALAVPNW